MDFKSYFQQPYQGGESFIENVIVPIFGEDKFEDAYEDNVIENNPELERMANATGISQILHLGTIDLPMNPTDVYDITVGDSVQMERNRVAIQQLIRRIMSTYSSAFMIFHYSNDNKWDWRFTFCSKQGSSSEFTDNKRYTFLLGPNQSCRTAADNFLTLYKKGGEIELDDIIKAFDVEALSKEFFAKYKEQYEKFCNYIYANKHNRALFGEEFSIWEEKKIRDYVKKLLGRIVFLHFLQKKGWMGVPAGKWWGEGDSQFMRNLFENASPKQKANYLDEVLEPLFADALDTDRTLDDDMYDTGVKGCREVQIPYLNGGLFECDELDAPKSTFPADYFRDLFDFFYQYNFTIDENDPNDAQVGVDPEMLGRIFENLLEDNKDKGAFYTPKEIVQYMCKESLIAHLQTRITGTDEHNQLLREFVETHDTEPIADMSVEWEDGTEEAMTDYIDRCLQEVKICDPAIGSGAFPMGLLKEIFYCRMAIEKFTDAAEIKKHIIQQNIYGVDIEKGAVDIARLRFWLALIVDEKTPHALPNMDFKIMQGNSLLEQFEGVDLSDLGYHKNKKEKKIGVQLSFFDNAADMSKKQFSIKMNEYFNEDDHSRKAQLREEIKGVVQQQLRNLEYNIDLRSIKDIASTDQFFLWHTWFSDVFDNGGFDIMIGNPPYVSLETLPDNIVDAYKKQGYKTLVARADLYCLFYERAYSFLNHKGCLCYITSNKWMCSGYGKALREFFVNKTNPVLLLDFAGTKVFNSASVDTNIILIHRDNNKYQTTCSTLGTLQNDELGIISEFVKANSTVCSFDSSCSWTILSKNESGLKSKIESSNVRLGDCDIEINWGIRTGYNDAFIINEESRTQILHDCTTLEEREKTNRLILPILRGRDIRNRYYQWNNLYVIGAYNGIYKILEKEYPAIYKHLSLYKEDLKKRGQVKQTFSKKQNLKKDFPGQHHWLELDNNPSKERIDDCYREKIIYPDISQFMNFVLCEPGYAVTNTAYYIVGNNNLKVLCGLLNSSVIHWYYKNISVQLGEATMRMFTQYVLQIPLPPEKSLLAKQNEIEYLVDRILSAKKANPLADTSAEEREIDRLVYDLYGLTEEEIAIVEGTKA